jgi:hypothetical protein
MFANEEGIVVLVVPVGVSASGVVPELETLSSYQIRMRKVGLALLKVPVGVSASGDVPELVVTLLTYHDEMAPVPAPGVSELGPEDLLGVPEEFEVSSGFLLGLEDSQ